MNFEQSRPLGVRRITSKPKSVLNPNFRFDHTRHPTGHAERGASAAADAARHSSGCNHCSGQKSGKSTNLGRPPTFADSSQSRQSCTRERRTTLASHRAIFAIHRCRRAAAAPTTHTREACRGTCSPSRCQHRGFVGSSRREEALKKPSAFGSASGNLPSPQESMRSLQASGRRAAPTRSCKQTPPQLLA